MRVDFGRIGVPLPAVRRSWTSRDALTYAVGVGGGVGEAGSELAFTTENSEGVAQRALPTFATLVGIGDPQLATIAAMDLRGLVHGGQAIELDGPLPVAATILLTTTVTGIFDKGSGMAVEYETQSHDSETGARLMRTYATMFIRGAGGFGGERGPATIDPVPTDRAADHLVTYRTSANQALIYRLTGDRNPLHSDPLYARRAGFSRPILHGLCSYGFVGRALLHSLCGSDPSRFRAMAARFNRPVHPGDDLVTSIWRTGKGSAAFRVADGVGTPVISNGSCTFA